MEIYELWDLSELQNVLCGFAPKGRITKACLRRLARYINFNLYDTKGKWNLGRLIKTVKQNTQAHRQEKSPKIEIIKALEPLQTLFYLNPEAILSHMEEKSLVTNVNTARAVALALMSMVGQIIDRFVKEDGLDANNDFWLEEGTENRWPGHH